MLYEFLYNKMEKLDINVDNIVAKKPLTSVWIFLVGYVMMLVFFILIGAGLAWIFGPEAMLEGSTLYILFGVQQLLTLLVLRWSLEEWWRHGLDSFVHYLNERNQRKGRGLFWKRVVGGFFGYMILNAVLYTVLDSTGIVIPGLYGEQWVVQMLQQINTEWAMDWIMMFLMVAIVWPIVEELVYRWLITDALMQRRRRWWVVLAAFIFALIHLEFAVFRNLFILAMILWVIYYKTQSMRYSFLFHLLINGMGVLALRLEQAYGLELDI